MTDAALLLLVVGGFYVAELFRRGSGGTTFYRALSGRWTWRIESRSLQCGNPLPFFAEFIALPQSLTDGAVLDPVDAPRLESQDAQKGRTTDRRQLRHEIDPEQHRHRIDEWRRATAHLKLAGTLQFLHVFAYSPLLSLRYGFERVWIPVFVWAAILDAVVAALFYRSHRRLHPHRRVQRWEHVAMMLVSPASAMRAAAALEAAPDRGTRPHGVALAALLLDRQQFIDYARRTLLDVRTGQAPAPADQDARAASSHAAFENSLPLALELHATSVTELLTPPTRDEQCATWCRRCHTQYRSAEGHCTDCGGLPLAGF